MLDTDAETAQELGVPMAAEAPFSPIGEESRRQNRRLLEAARAIVLAPFAVGPSNLVNLEDVAPFPGRCPVYLIDGSTLDRRDFTGGEALKVRDRLLSSGAQEVSTLPELIRQLRVDLTRPGPLRPVGRDVGDALAP